MSRLPDALAIPVPPSGEQVPRPASRARSLGPRLRRAVTERPGAAFGAGVLLVIVLLAIFAPVVAPYPPDQQVGPIYQAPSSAHWLGLSDEGFDVVSQLIWACRVSLLVGFCAALVSIVVGGAIGIVAGYFGGAVDLVLTAITDYFIVIPALPLLIVVAAVWGPSLFHIIISLGLLLWTTSARVIRAQVKSLRERTYVRRARTLGAGHVHTIFRHIVPHTAPLLVANTILTVSAAIFAETALAFLGLGDPSQASLGKLIENAYDRGATTQGAWWVLLPPGILVAVIVLCTTLVGLAIEEALSPRKSHVPFHLSLFGRRHRSTELPPPPA